MSLLSSKNVFVLSLLLTLILLDTLSSKLTCSVNAHQLESNPQKRNPNLNVNTNAIRYTYNNKRNSIPKGVKLNYEKRQSPVSVSAHSDATLNSQNILSRRSNPQVPSYAEVDAVSSVDVG
ncbi:17047_t:CDS:1 [Cetraspora pellucida]|uniref:17047_t:CDS:1 n=1 Tax=Cetraspora pellucida TaxID=1433469 RepID=A0ACA9KGT5_9GLOM|nr:17047_t:CDS:1 [Cetraspora pellucida]